MKYTMTLNRCKVTVDADKGAIYGNTYRGKEIIKEEFGAKWDAAEKEWKAEPTYVAAQIEKYADRYTRLYDLSPVAASGKQRATRTTNGICPICHTYCYGDCTAR